MARDNATTRISHEPKPTEAVCRFFGREDYRCDVGVPHPTAHDVEVMVRYCNGRFTECERYRMLARRWSGTPAAESVTPPPVAPNARLEESATSEVARGVLQHELRTPVAAILAASEILDGRPDRSEEVRQRYIGVIRHEANRLKKTLEDLFDGLDEVVEPGASGRADGQKAQTVSEPSERRSAMKQLWNRGWSVVLAGTGINLALGILYTWSIFKGEIRASIEAGGLGGFDWELSSINDPYAVCCLVFAFAMILAGRVQDRFGPRVTALIGGALVGGGFLVISQTSNYWMWVLGFGVMAGTGIGFGYSAATPPALKWFPPARTGLVAGIVVSGFGLASVYIAPLASSLLSTWGIHKSMFFFGIAFSVVVGLFSLMLTNPPEGYLFGQLGTKTNKDVEAAPTKSPSTDMGPFEMFHSRAFIILWVAFFVGSGAGLMVIGSVAGMAKASLGELAFLAVALMAVGNAGGRIVAGILSDKIGRRATLRIMLAAQAVLMFTAVPLVGAATPSAVALVTLATFIGFNYGTNLSLFPSLAKDLWGLKNFGINYGLLFSAWGIGGFVMGILSETLNNHTGSYTMSFLTAGGLLILGASLTLLLPGKEKVAAQETVTAVPAEPKVERVGMTG